MTSTLKPLKLTLEFLCMKRLDDHRELSFEPRHYRVRHTDGICKTVLFPWNDTELRRLQSELEKPNPSSVAFESLGYRLREFMSTTNWSRDEHFIERALEEHRPIDITIRADAAELYYLPWELFSLERSSRQLGELPDCIIRYEWPLGHSGNQSPNQRGRLLFASSAAGGGVPFSEHLEALQKSLENSDFTFDLHRDVRQRLTRKWLADELNAADRPVTALHLLCHGGRAPNGAYGLVLDGPDPDDGPELLDTAGLRKLLLPGTKPPRLVTLCVCQSGDAGPPAHILGSIARKLHQLGVPAVIASRFPLSVRGSILLTETLYAELLGNGASGSLRVALAATRKRLMHELSTADWASLQFYAREEDEAAIYPFRAPPAPPPVTNSPSRDLVLIRHEAYGRASVSLQCEDAPELFDDRMIRRRVFIDQTPELERLGTRTKKRLEGAVKDLVAPEGELMQALAEQDAELVYYGFPLVPLAVLAGFLAKTQRVRLFEFDRDTGRFTWVRNSQGVLPVLTVKNEPHDTGSAVRLRLSVSRHVELDDCRAVLPDSEVGLDLHFQLESPEKGIVRRAEQVQAYQELLRKTLGTHVEGKRLNSIHVFAAVPVSIAFSLGQVLASTGLPRCYVYNYNAEEKPRYKWRLCLHAAVNGRPAIDIFK